VLLERCRAIQRRNLAAHPPGQRRQQLIPSGSDNAVSALRLGLRA
jgi:hypothetical protein